MSQKEHDRRFFHSFPRPRKAEDDGVTLNRGLNILRFMKEFGLVLAPEIVQWDVSLISGIPKKLDILQRRACFTELSVAELPQHSKIFGPIALSFDLEKLRGIGATPVIYVPQGIESNPLSYIGTFCVNGAFHTSAVLKQLDNLKSQSDPEFISKQCNGMPVAPDCVLNLKNNDSVGNIVADYSVPLSNVHNILQHVSFNSIPFAHSVAILNMFQNIFYPTDNAHTGDELGYYRQREWRLIAADMLVNGKPISRNLSNSEIARLQTIDGQFWSKKILVEGVLRKRSDLAILYDPMPDWNFFDFVEEIFVSKLAAEKVRNIVGNKISVREHPYPESGIK